MPSALIRKCQNAQTLQITFRRNVRDRKSSFHGRPTDEDLTARGGTANKYVRKRCVTTCVTGITRKGDIIPFREGYPS